MNDIHKILVTTDLSDEALPGIEMAVSLARQTSSEVVLLYVMEDHLPHIMMLTSEKERDALLEEHRKRAGKRLEEYAARHLADCGGKTGRGETVALQGVPEREIVRYADGNGVDLIVMASHGYGPVRQLLLGSTTERVLHHAHCPVLVVPTRGD